VVWVEGKRGGRRLEKKMLEDKTKLRGSRGVKLLYGKRGRLESLEDY
jgi:hypothetical protein